MNCKGDISLGTACMVCPKCEEELAKRARNMPTIAREIVVDKIFECPFSERDMDNEITTCYADTEGREYESQKNAPDWCPLRQGAVLVRMEGGE